MIAKIAILFAGMVVAMMLAMMYAFALLFVTATLLGVDNTAAFLAQYLVCLVAGAVSALVLMRRVWPTAAHKKAGLDQTTAGSA